MARVGDAGNGMDPSNFRATAKATAEDPAAQSFGVSAYSMRQIQNYLNSETINTTLGLTGEEWEGVSFLGGLNMAPANNPDPTRGIYAEQKAIFGPKGGMTETGFERLQKFGVQSWADEFYNPKDVRNLDPSDYNENFVSEPGKAAALVDIPTSSSNYQRPRTVAAGYDYDENSDTGTITVVFRDGTFWNYYKVPSSVWITFHHEFSKGPMLNRGGSGWKQSQDGVLLSYENGPADMSKLTKTAREALYKAARTVQIYNREPTKRVRSNGEAYSTYGTGQGGQAKRARKAAIKSAYNRNKNAAKPRKNPNQK